MRFTLLSGVRNDLVQLISDQTAASELHTHQIETDNTAILAYLNNLPNLTNPRPRGLTYNYKGAPIAFAQQGFYLVPVNRRAVIRAAYITHNLATTNGGTTSSTVLIEVNDISAGTFDLMVSDIDEPALGAIYGQTLAMDMHIVAGDAVRLYYGAVGAGDTFNVNIAVSVMEYDA